MKKFLGLVFTGILWVNPLAHGGDAKEATPTREKDQPLAVAIDIPLHRGDRSLQIDSGKWLPFHVILTNKSDKPIKLWMEWSSWGYYSLSFEIEDASGKKWIVEKGATGWRNNYPDFFTLPAGESVAWDVQWKDKVWLNLPNPYPPGGGYARKPFKMRAIFKIEGDEDSNEYGVWTGKIYSKWNDYWTWPTGL